MSHDLSNTTDGLTRDHSPLTTHQSLRTVVAKVGGSLLDWPQLADRLQRWLAALGTPRVVLVVGGGPAADLVRRRDQWDDLGDDKSHWLAVRAMTFNGYLLEGLLENAKVVASLRQCESLWQDGVVPILTSALSSRIKGGVWNQAEIKQIVLEKCLKVVFGEDILTNMERF